MPTGSKTKGCDSADQLFRCSSPNRDFLELAARIEADPLGIGREECIAAAFRAGQQRGFGLIEQARGKLLFPIRPARGIHDASPVGRNRDRRD